MDRSIIALLGLNTVLEYPENKGPEKGMKETEGLHKAVSMDRSIFPLCPEKGHEGNLVKVKAYFFSLPWWISFN